MTHRPFALFLFALITPLYAAETATPAAPAVATAPPPQPDFFTQVDSNKDDQVSEEEFINFNLPRIKASFQRMDANSDGKVTRAEIVAEQEKMREMFNRQMQHRPPQGAGQGAPGMLPQRPNPGANPMLPPAPPRPAP
ncbi:MAG: hypothetical protein HQL49_00620 [Gammaproteobacteria bacterium]|nr:hypothetical protein [Gammaproteobacteria bacterium]